MKVYLRQFWRFPWKLELSERLTPRCARKDLVQRRENPGEGDTHLRGTLKKRHSSNYHERNGDFEMHSDSLADARSPMMWERVPSWNWSESLNLDSSTGAGFVDKNIFFACLDNNPRLPFSSGMIIVLEKPDGNVTRKFVLLIVTITEPHWTHLKNLARSLRS